MKQAGRDFFAGDLPIAFFFARLPLINSVSAFIEAEFKGFLPKTKGRFFL
jgi:hypothetical protein